MGYFTSFHIPLFNAVLRPYGTLALFLLHFLPTFRPYGTVGKNGICPLNAELRHEQPGIYLVEGDTVLTQIIVSAATCKTLKEFAAELK